ncbi:hypothetical protein EV645_6515 [Kribbella rubisoli]|uniref:Uncharacterized protein n=1 Tax=Kribbella rubisoli TaxID=3075929 RepID=A0A4Q7WQ71_9ACTN|nr:hypothetical protein [Kribbella rubisoli]RZU11349.1 hypothetical protein EV645_6515 [Kribbella rubisoli]
MTTAPHASTLADDDREDIELPLWPFQDLRVASGMLLGTEDFHVMLGNPRGKMRLHQAWLHGSGVVWGLPVTCDKMIIDVGPGLAIDGRGHELRIEARQCRDLGLWANEWLKAHRAASGPGGCGCSTPTPDLQDPDDDGCGTHTHNARVYVVLQAEFCLDRMVPALADPCDTTREHNEASRVLETARLDLVETVGDEWLPYPRLRALFGLEPGSKHAEPNGVVALAAERIANAEPDQRAKVLLDEARCLAAADVTELEPPTEPGSTHPDLFPTEPAAAPVILARLDLKVADDGCIELAAPIDICERRAILPSRTIQELLCGDAFGAGSAAAARGPRLEDNPTWTSDLKEFSFRLTKPAVPGSEESAVEVSSLSRRGLGWAREETRRIWLDDDGRTVHVQLEHAPSYATVRVIIRGTGRTPLYGRAPHVPFAGRTGVPPGLPGDGRDAVVTVEFNSLEPDDVEKEDDEI